MARESEEDVIASSLLILAAVTAVGWYAWIATSARPTGIVTLVILGSFALTLFSVPIAVIAIFLYERLDRDWALVARSVALALLLAVFAATAYVFLWGVDSPLVIASTAVALASIWIVLPLSIGAISAATGRVSMIGVLLALPPSNLLALTVFLAPTPGGIDFATDTALSLGDPLRSGLLLVVFAAITLGPALFGRLMDRLITVRVADAPA